MSDWQSLSGAGDCGFDTADGFIGVATLASGTEVRSQVEQLDRHIVDHIAEHNRHARP